MRHRTLLGVLAAGRLCNGCAPAHAADHSMPSAAHSFRAHPRHCLRHPSKAAFDSSHIAITVCVAHSARLAYVSVVGDFLISGKYQLLAPEQRDALRRTYHIFLHGPFKDLCFANDAIRAGCASGQIIWDIQGYRTGMVGSDEPERAHNPLSAGADSVECPIQASHNTPGLATVPATPRKAGAAAAALQSQSAPSTACV